MFPLATKQAGMAMGMPDVCKTPTPAGPVPVPYPNIVQLPMANIGTTTKKVTASGQKIILKKTVVPISTGDEAGSAAGVISGTIKGEAKFTRVSVKVKMEGQPVAFHTGTLTMNKKNLISGIHAVPSQAKIFIGR